MEIKNETITISFDPGDWAAMQKLCSEHEKYPCQLWGRTSNNEDCIIEICADHITTEVFQKNGWVRKNVSILKRTRWKRSTRKNGENVQQAAKRKQEWIGNEKGLV